MRWRRLGYLPGALLAILAGPTIWWAGADVPDVPATARFLVAMALPAVYLLIVAGRASVAPRPAGDALGNDLDALDEDFQELLRPHRAAWLRRRGRLDRFDRPWYLAIGPDNAGKTNLISSLDLRPVSPAHASGRLGCGWWVGDSVVIGDVAARYGVHSDVESREHTVWLALLDLLRRMRRTVPLDGLFVVLSLPDLIKCDARKRREWGEVISERISEAERRLGLRLPVYVVLTKADGLPGFVESFSHLDRRGANRPLGRTFSLEEGSADPGKAVSDVLGELVSRLNDKALAQAMQDPDPAAPPAILRFLPALEAARGPASAFATIAFGRGLRGRRPLLRGLFLASAPQNAADGDGTGAERPYFTRNLAASIRNDEGALANWASGVDRRRLWGQLFLWAVSIALCLGSLLMMLQYSERQHFALSSILRLAKDERVKLTRLPGPDTLSLTQVLTTADAWDGLTRRFDADGAPAWQSRLFDHPIENDIHRRLSGITLELTSSLLLPTAVFRLERDLRAPATDAASVRAMLTVYDMLTGAATPDVEVIASWLEREFAITTPADRDSLRRHVSALLSAGLLRYRRNDGLLAAVNQWLDGHATPAAQPAPVPPGPTR
jgi:type VI secretion system protein ImpL